MTSARATIYAPAPLIDNVELANVQELEAIVARLPAALMSRILSEGGPLIREKLLAPTFASMEREGVVEWTGRVAPNGQKIWRSLIYTDLSVPQPTDSPGSDKT